MSDHDLIELKQLVYRYAAAVDASDVAAFLAVFAPEGRLRSYHPGAEEPFADLIGHAQLVTIPNAMRTMFRHTAHMISNHLVEVDGDDATGSLLCTARHLSIDPSVPAALTVVLRHLDHYERRSGVWQIVDRQIRFLWSERHEVVDGNFMAGPQAETV